MEGGLAKQLTALYPGQVIVNFNNFYDSGGRIVNGWGGGGESDYPPRPDSQ